MDCVVVMGVSGSGKTTLGSRLATTLGWAFAEGDDFHPAANVAKMRRGAPLDDADRWPWLDAVAEWMDGAAARDEPAVVACSALRRSYRDRLRKDRPFVRFCLVDVPRSELIKRLERRTGHFMPGDLLASQLATLEPLEPDEPGVVCPGTGSPEVVLARMVEALGLRARED